MDSLVHGFLEPGTLECWKDGVRESWAFGTSNLAPCNLNALLSRLESDNPVKNPEPVTFWICRVDPLRWFIAHSAQTVCIFWFALHCAGHFVAVEYNQDPYKSGTLMLGTLNPGNLEPQGPWQSRTLENLGTLPHNMASLEPWSLLLSSQTGLSSFD